jgi:hypothetical protein
LKRQNKYIEEEREEGILGRQMCSSPTDAYWVSSPSFRISKIIKVEIKNYKKNTLKKLKKERKKKINKKNKTQLKK